MRYVILLTFLLLPVTAASQWELVHDFGGLNTYIRSIYFLHQQGAPHIGFVGVADAGTSIGTLMRTSDAGKTWFEVGHFEEHINEIAFKDQDTGWLVASDRSNINGACYETIDGGNSWRLMPGSAGARYALEYLVNNNLLLISGWHTDSKSTTDRGKTWSLFSDCRNGYAFLDELKGIVATVRGGGCEGQPYHRTTDGGKTWIPSSDRMDKECWQPVAIPDHNLYLSINEPWEGDIYGSTDFGDTWHWRGNLGEREQVTGQLVYDGCLLHAQSFSFGISVSTDFGYTWQHLGGPGAIGDTRLYQVADTMYAGDLRARLWVNHNKAYPANRLNVNLDTSDQKEMIVTVSLPSLRPLHGFGVDTAIFSLEYSFDELELVEETSAKFWRFKRKVDLGSGNADYYYYRKPVHLGEDTVIAHFKFRPLVSASGRGGYVRVTNVRFDSLSPGVSCMKLNIPVDSVFVGVAPECGDSILSRYLANGIKGISIKSINPNPTNGSITIDYESRLSGAVTLSVYSVNGVLVHEEVVALAGSSVIRAGKPIQLDASSWPSGAYTIVLKSGDEEARGNVIKN